MRVAVVARAKNFFSGQAREENSACPNHSALEGDKAVLLEGRKDENDLEDAYSGENSLSWCPRLLQVTC